MAEQSTLSMTDATEIPEPAVAVGELARDVEREESDPLVVLEHTDALSNEVVIYETPPADDDITVATYNEDYGYAPTEPVSRGVYRDSIIEALGEDWSVDAVLEAHEADALPEDVQVYSFPRTRLQDPR